MSALIGFSMVQLCELRFLARFVRRFNGRIYGGRWDGARS